LPQLTERQRNLLAIINQLSQNTSSVLRGATEHAVELPTVDLNLDFGRLGRTRSEATPVTPPSAPAPGQPENVPQLLATLVNEQVEITTPYGVVSGVLLAVRDDYVVVVQNDAHVLVRTEKIELLNEL
jgi:hypothetical protein